MHRLRARHWLAVTAAFALIVSAWVLTSTGGVESIEVDRSALMPPPVEDSTDATQEVPERLVLGAEQLETSESSGPLAPLTGLPSTADQLDRPALVVKVDNHPTARPQPGLDQADIVFDYRAEGVTRFAAVFHSQTPDPVGPVRLDRTADFDLLRGLDTPLYASTGANDFVAAGLRSLPIVELTNRTRNEYFRDLTRPAPHNLYINGSDLYALAPEDVSSPQPWFTYRRDGSSLPPSAVAVAGPVSVSFRESPVVTHQWDETLQGWIRSQDGAPHLTAGGDQLAPENVVIMVTDYGVSPADPISPEVRSTGSGDLVVLTAGHTILGRWERPEPEDKPTLVDVDGQPIDLTPGRTWVLLPEEGQVAIP